MFLGQIFFDAAGCVGRGSIGRGNPNPKKTDSLGRKRLAPEAYSQAGGDYYTRHIVWRCKNCSRAWNLTTRSSRYDSKCRQCGTRNSISLVRRRTLANTRGRVTKFEEYSNPEDAEIYARILNLAWMKARTPKYLAQQGFVKANLHKKPTGSIDAQGHHHPKTREMSEF